MLTSEEAKKRLATYGENSIEEKERSKWALLFSFFWGPIPWMIEIAAVLSALLEKWPDLIIILSLLIFNALIGFLQEYKAQGSIAALKQQLALTTRVNRDGKWQEMEAKYLVPGDTVLVKIGNIVPADIKLGCGEYLSVDQSALTGESLPVDKKVGDTAYSGTIVKQGEMEGEVTATGMNSFFGKTAKLVSSAKTISHFQEAVMKIGRFLIYATLAIALIIFSISLFRIEEYDLPYKALSSEVIFVLVLIIAGIPIALPAVLSVTLAIGAKKIAKYKAIVAKLIAIEELASMDVLCCDKTGTLTKNELTLGEVEVFQGTKEELLLTASLACNMNNGDPIDLAILKYANLDLQSYAVLKFTPFDPVIKRTEAKVKTPNGEVLFVMKGAPQMILSLCRISDEVKQKAEEKVFAFASRGYRSLGVAKKEGDSFAFLGFLSLFDPPREDTLSTIRETKALGIRVKMITGDHVAIAKETAQQLELGSHVIPASSFTHLVEDIQHAKSHESAHFQELEKTVAEADGFAEVFPEHKFAIVKAMQHTNHIVGMTGDGVNDAPALKQADAGIAVSNATDAARAAADLILTQPGLMVITKAIEEARRIFGRMRSYAMYRISETVRVLLFLSLAMLVFEKHPLSAIMLIFIALLNDFPIMMIAYDHMPLKDKPVRWNMNEVVTIAVGLAIVGVVSTFMLYWIGQRFWGFNVDQSRTLAFIAILCGGNLTIFLTRNQGRLLDSPLPEWKFFLATLSSQITGSLVSVYGIGTRDFVGIGWKYVGFSWIYIIVWFGICYATKLLLYRTLRSRGTGNFMAGSSRAIAR